MDDPVDDPVDVVVVGAGLAGLTAARDLEAAGRSVVVVEARDRVGGRTVNHTFADGTVAELGGQWIGPTQDRMAALAAAMGVETFPTYDQGQNITVTPGRVVRYRDRSLGLPKLALAEIGVAQKRLERMAGQVPLDTPWTAPKAERWDSQTFETWIRRNLRTSVGQGFYRLATEAVFSAEPADLSLLHWLFYCHSGGLLDRLLNTRNGAQQDRFAGGSQLVSERLAATLHDVRLGSPVRHLDQTGDGVVVTHDGGQTRAASVVVTVPPAVAARIAYSPGLPAARDHLTQKMPMGYVIKCMAVYDEPFWRTDGLSGQSSSLVHPVSVTFDNSPASGRPGVLLGFIEGDHGRRAGALPAGERRQLVLDGFARLFGPRAGRPVDYAELDWATEEWTRGCYGAHLPPAAWTRYGPALREPCGRIHWAGTETSDVWAGYMDGAVRSGERVAAEVLPVLD